MIRIFLAFLLLFPSLAFAAPNANLRDTTSVTADGSANSDLTTFAENSWIANFFFTPVLGSDAPESMFITVAEGIKNFFVLIAVLFLIIGVLKLFFGSGEEEDLKKWKKNIIWVSVGIFMMQIALSIWKSLYLKTDYSGVFIDGRVGWIFWRNIFEPIVNILLVLSSFAFLMMAVYSFYILVTSNGDEERSKKGKNIILYAIIGFLLIRVPKPLVTAIYGKPTDACGGNSWISIGTCTIGNKDLAGSINIFGKILNYISGFLTLFAVVLIIYAGWLIFISGGDEEQLKKAKNIFIYVAIGFIALVASHAVFRFFFLQG